MIPKSSNDNRRPPFISRLRARFTVDNGYSWFSFLTERISSIGLGMHFLLFMGMPFMVFEYVADRLLLGQSKPPMENGLVVLKIPEASWQGFFWLMNFYAALIVAVMLIWLLYVLWDKTFKRDAMIRVATKAAMCAAVAFGIPLKLVYRYAMMVPESYAPDLNYLGVLDITEIARSDLFSFEGGWFFSRYAVLPPFLLLVTYILQRIIESRAAAAKGNVVK